ncbi:MAG: hypothetical protein AAF869_00585 [Pseudomonadota bacterium]
MGRLVAPSGLRIAARAYLVVALVCLGAAGGLGAYAIGVSGAIHRELTDPAGPASLKERTLEALALTVRDGAALSETTQDRTKLIGALEDARLEATRYADLVETDQEAAAASDILRAVDGMNAVAVNGVRGAEDLNRFLALQAAVSTLIDSEARAQARRRAARLEAWARWSGRAAMAALGGSAVVLLLGIGFLSFANRRRRADQARSASRLETSLDFVELSGVRLAKAVEAVERGGMGLREARRDMAETTRTLIEIGHTLGDGTGDALNKLNAQADAVAQTAGAAAKKAQAEVARLAQARQRGEAEFERARVSLAEMETLLRAAQPSVLAAIEQLSASAQAFDHASEAASARFEEAAAQVATGGERASAGYTKANAAILALCDQVSSAFSEMRSAADGLRRVDEDTAAQAAQLAAAKDSLHSGLAALTGDDGLLARILRRLEAHEARWSEGRDEAAARLETLSERTGAGLLAVLKRLDATAGALESAADGLTSSEHGQAAAATEALRLVLRLAETNGGRLGGDPSARRDGPRLATV